MTATTNAPSTVTGVLGGRWRADVTASGDVLPWDGSPPLMWHVAADDRWHTPSAEPSVRQVLLDGTPVVETRLRIPNGDAVQRVWSVADQGGLTVIEVENDSPLPIAVAFTRRDLLSVRPPTDMPLEGIELPAGSVAFPVGHHSTITVALAHDGRGAGTLPAGLAPALQVARGWMAMCDRAGRFVLPDDVLVAAATTARCALALGGPGDPDDDPAAFLLGVGQLVRMGEEAEPWLPDVAHAAERVARAARRGGDWLTGATLDAASAAFDAAGDRRAAGDLAAMRARLTIDPALPPDPPDGITGVAWLERRLADPAGHLFPAGIPAPWLGATVETYGLQVGNGATVSFALRWHGARPAILWEVVGASVTLTAPVVAPGWSSSSASGEALWPPPPGAELLETGSLDTLDLPATDLHRPLPEDGTSFS
ncbi:MAG: hypothetical protein ABIR68_12930 [Ilumatobacteraceae bacterium]